MSHLPLLPTIRKLLAAIDHALVGDEFLRVVVPSATPPIACENPASKGPRMAEQPSPAPDGATGERDTTLTLSKK